MVPQIRSENLRPEDCYKGVTTPNELKRIETQVVLDYRRHVRRLVRKLLPAKNWREAQHVGEIGLLVALKKFGPERGVPFWAFAQQWVRLEIQNWIDSAVQMQRRSHDARYYGEGARQEKRPPVRVVEFDERTHGAKASVEEVVADAEARERLQAFLETLTETERHLLLCEKRAPGAGRKTKEGKNPKPNSKRERGYLSLIERGRAFLGGKNGR